MEAGVQVFLTKLMTEEQLLDGKQEGRLTSDQEHLTLIPGSVCPMFALSLSVIPTLEAWDGV